MSSVPASMTHAQTSPDPVTGPLWPDAYAVRWPRSGGGGTCSHYAPDSCAYCDGSLDDLREADKVRRAARKAATR